MTGARQALARLRETRVQCTHRLDFRFATQHPAFQLEVVEAVFGMGCLGLSHDRLGCERLGMAHAMPVSGRVGFRGGIGVGKPGLRAITDEGIESAVRRIVDRRIDS